MMKVKLMKGLMLPLAVLSMVAACRKKDAPLPDNLVDFESTEQGISAAENSKTVKLTLTRAVNADAPITISLTPSAGVEYGTDFTTAPAAVANSITATALSGSSEVSFTINKAPGALFYEDDNIVFTITSSGGSVIIGNKKEFKLSFAEIISTGSSIVGSGGGSTYGNKVFFDLSANSQTAVQRTKWDLGFYTGVDDWRVILNSSTAMMAKQIAKNDLTTVTAADTAGFSDEVIFSQSVLNPLALAYIDYPDGDLTKTAIASISATAADNKVYIINRGTGIGTPAPARGWKKVRIIRNATGYILQHADIAATTFSSIDIPKEATHFFKYISFETGAVDVEPPAKKWDFAWTYFSNVFNAGGEIPYLFQDFIVQNRNVEVAKLDDADKAYADFSEADLSGPLTLTWSGKQNAIGSDWRIGGGPTTPPSMRPGRYYILKDGDGNYYKLRFTALTQNGERGYPAFEFALIKKAP